MEFSGINLILIILAPVAVIFVIVFLIYPLQKRLFDREQPLRKEMEDKGVEFKKEVKQKLKDLKESWTSPGFVDTFEGTIGSNGGVYVEPEVHGGVQG